MKKIVFDVSFSGEPSAGLASYTDIVSIKIESGNTGGEDGEFEQYIIDCLSEWYDGAKVEVRKETECNHQWQLHPIAGEGKVCKLCGKRNFDCDD